MSILFGTALFVAEEIMPRIDNPKTMLSLGRLDLRFDLASHMDILQRKTTFTAARDLAPQLDSDTRKTSEHLFRLFGVPQYEDIDVDSSQDCTVTHDLNVPVSVDLHSRYDFIFEHGTLEHVFDTRTALSSIVHMAKLDGWVCHVTPLSFVNHGFYNFSLNLFDDFYRLNGFDEFKYWILAYRRSYLTDQELVVAEMPYCSNWIYLDQSVTADMRDQLCLAVLAKKCEQVPEIRVPVQSIFDPTRRSPWRPLLAKLHSAPGGTCSISLEPASNERA